MNMKRSQVLSIHGMLGACHGVKPNENDVYYVTSRLCSNCSATSDKMIVDNIIRHHTGELILHCMRQGDVVFPIFPHDLESSLLDNCPAIIVDDHIRCWNSMNENLVGVSLTLPMFSDGNADYKPWKMARVAVQSILPTYVHSFCNDEFNKNYSGFAYLPEAFRMENRLSQEKLSMCTTCIYHVAKIRQVESEGKLRAAERYMMSKCTPLPDELASIVVRDDKFKKVPRTNSALRHSLLALCTFKCLIVFSSTRIQSTYFSLSGYELAGEDWQLDMLYNTSNKLKNLNFGHAECHLANTKQALNCGLKNLLFF